MEGFSLPNDSILGLPASVPFPSSSGGLDPSLATSDSGPNFDHWLNPALGSPFDPAGQPSTHPGQLGLHPDQRAMTPKTSDPAVARRTASRNASSALARSSSQNANLDVSSASLRDLLGTNSSQYPSAALMSNMFVPGLADSSSSSHYPTPFPLPHQHVTDQNQPRYPSHINTFSQQEELQQIARAATSFQNGSIAASAPEDSGANSRSSSKVTSGTAGTSAKPRTSTNGAPAPIGTNSTKQPPKAPQQPDESVPEAALHLLRLALPTGSNGSVATTTTLDEENASCDEDAEGESDATSVHSDGGTTITKGKGKGKQQQRVNQQQEREQQFFQELGSEPRVWDHTAGPQAAVAADAGAGSRADTAKGNADPAFVEERLRLHRIARAQREKDAERAVVEQGGAGGRRMSGRVRKPIVSSRVKGDDSDASMSEPASEDDDEELIDMDDDSDSDLELGGSGKRRGSKGKGKGRTSSSSRKSGPKRSIGGPSNPTPAKKPRTSSAGGSVQDDAGTPSSTTGGGATARRPRRQPVAPVNLRNRTFPAHVEISSLFPRFYRAFPISSAFPPDSYVHRLRPSQAAAAPASASSGSSTSMGATHALSTANLANAHLSQQLAGILTTPYSMNGNAGPIASGSSGSGLPVGYGQAAGGSAIGNFGFHNNVPAPPPPASTAASTTALDPQDPAQIQFLQPPFDAKWNKSTDPLNLYAPKFVKGNADQKSGMCPICIEPVERGGEGEEKWLKLKNSSFVYHMSYAHGLSNLSGLPFSPPLETRLRNMTAGTKDAREQMTEGLCHKCNEWIPLLSVKNIEAVVPELIWWKHAKKCHGTTTIQGETDPYLDDAVYRLVASHKNTRNHGTHGTHASAAATNVAAPIAPGPIAGPSA